MVTGIRRLGTLTAGAALLRVQINLKVPPVTHTLPWPQNYAPANAAATATPAASFLSVIGSNPVFRPLFSLPVTRPRLQPMDERSLGGSRVTFPEVRQNQHN